MTSPSEAIGRDFANAAIDHVSADRLSRAGLRLDLVDTADDAAFAAWRRATVRGFHGPALSDSVVAAHQRDLGFRRTTGVWDPASVDLPSPIATSSSWPNSLNVPGEGTVTAWAITAVTVAPTHRRKGIARAMVEAELRTAASLGAPLAMLTVSESTIYGRFGFAPAALATSWSIDVRRTGWVGPESSGRLHLIDPDDALEIGPELHVRALKSSAGEIALWPSMWSSMLGINRGDSSAAERLSIVRYDDAEGVTQGLAFYRVLADDTDFTQHTLKADFVVAATDDAYAGLWRYLLGVDLVSTVTASLLSVDEPLYWQLSDPRAARITVSDHLWLRIIDVKASLEARRYFAAGTLVLEVADDLGFAAGRFLLKIDEDGRAVVTTIGDVPTGGTTDAATDATAIVSLTVNELSGLYLGGVSAITLVRAGHITELAPGSAAALDRSFRGPRPPALSVWF